MRKSILSYCLAGLLIMLLYAKCVIFQSAVFHHIETLDGFQLVHFLRYHIAQLLFPLFIGSFWLVTRRSWWTIVVCLLVDIWCVSNIIYFRSYDSFLTVSHLSLAGNMTTGVWASITAYLDYKIALIPLLTLIWAIVVSAIRLPRRALHPLLWTAVVAVLFVVASLNNYLIYNRRFWPGADSVDTTTQTEINDWLNLVNKHGGHVRYANKWVDYLPFYEAYYTAAEEGDEGAAQFVHSYVSKQSILSYFVAANIYYLFCKDNTVEKLVLTAEERQQLSTYLHPTGAISGPNEHLIILVVESLESWMIENDIEGFNFTPNLRRLVGREHVIYFDRLKNQTLGGNSADGQMIINTGLLPTQNQVVSMHYAENVFPNIASFFPSAVVVNSWPGLWNKDTMFVRYGYTELIEPTSSSDWEDAEVLSESLARLRCATSPTCLMALTISTHVPFNRVHVPQSHTSAPAVLDRYLSCMHYTDSCIGVFMDALLADPALSASTVVITGDHTIFRPGMLHDFHSYAAQQHLPIASGENYCPLIIYSPHIDANRHNHTLCYQMDIYPTMLSLTGCDSIAWRGLGINLLDTIYDRQISEEQAYRLSDKMIRSDFFR